jgi:Ca-activated chloride channel family protein
VATGVPHHSGGLSMFPMRRIYLSLLGLTLPLFGLMLPGILRSQDLQTQNQGPYKISVNVGLVVLNPIVQERSGHFASKLHETDFEVYEDGVRQAIRLFRHEDVPVTVGLIVDHSGSMRQKLPEVVEAARIFIRSSNPADEMFVVNFNEKVSLGLPGSLRFTNQMSELEGAISSMHAAGKTALYDAVAHSYEWLKSGSREKKVLVVISDGGDNASSLALPAILRLAEQSGAVVYTIGVFDSDDEDRNPGVLTKLAHITGGEAFFPKEVSDLVQVCENISRDIRHQYTLGYVSSNNIKSGGFRKIRVAAKSADYGKLTVRARSGYSAGKAEGGSK